MKKIISLILAVAMVTSVAAIPTSAASDPFADKVAGRIPQDTWTAREVSEGTTVTLLPDYSEDMSQPVAEIKNGGFETANPWSDVLNTAMFWWDGDGNTDWQPWTVSTEVKLEGKQSGCVDISPAMAEKSKQTPARLPFMGFLGVNIAPCFTNEVYHLRFYVKTDRELGAETPQVMVYLLDTAAAGTGVDNLEKVVGTKNIVLDASNIDYHWYDQNEIKFDQGQNPTGKYTQGFGPFYQGKWIQIDSYFVTPEDFQEGAYSIQIHTQTGADCKLYFDGFSLEKTTMDQVDMGVALKSVESDKTVQFTKKSVKIKKGKKVTLKVKLSGAKKATFSVDKKGKKVVKLSKKKAKSVVVTGKKKGKATITAKAAGKKATCKVTVK